MSNKNRNIKIFLLVGIFLILGIFIYIFLESFTGITCRIVKQENWFYNTDINRDTQVDEDDLNILNDNFKRTGCGDGNSWCNNADIDKDSRVDLKDFDLLSHSFGKTSCYEGISSNCTPSFVCGNWSKCDVDYNFDDLLEKPENIQGKQFRLCIDENECASSYYNYKSCIVGLDIYAVKTKISGEDYIEIYERATGKLLSKIKDNKDLKEPSLDISFFS
jgi:hypothetical protein